MRRHRINNMPMKQPNRKSMKSLTTIKIYRYAIEAFGDTRESGTTGRSEMVVSGSGWTGGCVDAKRGGFKSEGFAH